ncbi:MAG: GNAT family N-acetyltransferase [Sulfitobacter sp.]|nr:GNAT family N-acetyltransferase [Sulfitobacter sp.]
MTVTVRPITAEDREGWDRLYAGYAAFYRVDQSPEMRDRVFGWLLDETHEVEGLVAEDTEGRLIGLTHYRPFASPLRAATNGFLDDLFVEPAARGSGAARAMIEAVAEVARARGWLTVRWITADNNYRARGLYDRLATRTQWVTYDLKP